ncbi:hypothetical protein FGO68_gene5715 [Halteria grandinella]|uniref:HTH La-type RNA-binding domain-containing protein n=1 Tax=Halteria grandinella TaxID=5974 RepID=A0A8J8T832_HALGN|nr:hypothetical protein FGO68_gene5715 [Halteria grandinella]
MEPQKLAKIKEQVEFYLSDRNLIKDIYFQKIIREAGKDGWFEIQHILQCNVIKRLNATDKEIVEALKGSINVEVNESKSLVRRFGGAPLPELSSSASGFQKYSGFKPSHRTLQRSFNKSRDF